MNEEYRVDRDRLIADAMKTGMSKTDASVLVDISAHAFRAAVEAGLRIIDTAPIELRKAALASVAGSWIGVLTEHFPDHWKQIRERENPVSEPTVIVLPPRQQEQG